MLDLNFKDSHQTKNLSAHTSHLTPHTSHLTPHTSRLTSSHAGAQDREPIPLSRTVPWSPLVQGMPGAKFGHHAFNLLLHRLVFWGTQG
jgi:hypothetical protein